MPDFGYIISSINGKDILISKTKGDVWTILLLSKDKEDFSEFNYVDHINFKFRPDHFTLIKNANFLIHKHFKNEKTS